MYRAIICVTRGELKGPNPAFRTRKACDQYWHMQMYQCGIAIDSFVTYEFGNPWDGDKAKLHGRFLKLRDKMQPLTAGEVEILLDSLQEMRDEDVDLAMGDMMYALWERKEREVKKNKTIFRPLSYGEVMAMKIGRQK